MPGAKGEERESGAAHGQLVDGAAAVSVLAMLGSLVDLCAMLLHRHAAGVTTECQLAYYVCQP